MFGFAESYTQGYVSTRWSDLLVFLLLILFLVFRPQGILGKQTSGRCEMSGGYDDELSRPVEGALEASTSEGAASPAVGRDEWVSRHSDNLLGRGGRLGELETRLRVVPWWAWLTVFVILFSLVPSRPRAATCAGSRST